VTHVLLYMKLLMRVCGQEVIPVYTCYYVLDFWCSDNLFVWLTEVWITESMLN